jgi:microcystin-dependent protein
MDSYIGQILLFPYDFVPKNYVACDGSALPISEYAALYSLIGNRFGGNGTSHFQVPNLLASSPSGCTYVIATAGIYPSRP